MLQQSCSVCSRETTAPCAPVEHLYLLIESCCSTCSSRAAMCAPAKLLLHNAPLEHLYLLLESSCSTRSSRAALCAPAKLLLHNAPLERAHVSAPRELLLHALQQSGSLCSLEAAGPCAPVEQLYLLPESHCYTCSNIAALCALGKQLLIMLQCSCCICSQ